MVIPMHISITIVFLDVEVTFFKGSDGDLNINNMELHGTKFVQQRFLSWFLSGLVVCGKLSVIDADDTQAFINKILK